MIEIELESDVERRAYVLCSNSTTTNIRRITYGVRGHGLARETGLIAMKQKQMLKRKGGTEEEIVEAVQANVVIKADTQGSLDSIRAAIETFPQKKSNSMSCKRWSVMLLNQMFSRQNRSRLPSLRLT